MTFSAKCANSKCGAINIVPDDAVKFCCSECGILNTPQREGAGTGEEACGCLLPESFEWKLPVGGINSVTGEKIYTTADDATPMSRVKWVECFGYDPEIVLQKMRDLGKEGAEGFYNLSTLGKRKPK